MSTKVLVYWLKERMWSVVSESAVRGDDIQPGEFAQTKFQGKFYSSIIIAKDEPKAIEKAEEAFRDFLNSCLIEEAAENVCSCIIDYIKAKSPVMKAFEAKEPQPNQTAEHKLDKETQGIAPSSLLTKGLGLKYNRTNEAAQKEAVSVKEFRELKTKFDV